jgi:hypothetical protein
MVPANRPGVEIGSDVPLQEIWESNEGEAILARRRVVSLIWVWFMRLLLDTEVSWGKGMRIQTGSLVQKAGPNLAPREGKGF